MATAVRDMQDMITCIADLLPYVLLMEHCRDKLFAS